MDQYGEIALHTVTHTTQKNTTTAHWYEEVTENFNLIKNYSKLTDIQGGRAPFLAFAPDFFGAL